MANNTCCSQRVCSTCTSSDFCKDCKLSDDVRKDVSDYYGKRLTSGDDFQTFVCPTGKMAPYLREIMASIHADVKAKYYGCGLIAPAALEGCHVLDLGSGAGMDCFVLSKLVGENGHVTGLDMTDEQLDVARRYVDHHTAAFRFKKKNVDFVKGYMEQLADAGLQEERYDVIVSNCVINLSPDKKRVLEEAYKVLKVGGEMYFSDVYADKPVPEQLRQHKVLWGECITGALSWEELHSIAEETGFCRPRLVSVSKVDFKNEEHEKIVEGYRFVSATYRLFKLPKGATQPASLATYKGTIPNQEQEFQFDHKYTFKKDEVLAVDQELSTVLRASRFREHFEIALRETGVPCCDRINPFELLENQAATSNSCCAR